MDRRTFGTTMVMGSLGLAAAPALGQGRRVSQAMNMMRMGPAEHRHVMETLQHGAVALETSRIAQTRAQNPMVRQFANFEVEEQTGIAAILRELMPMAPPPPSAADRQMTQQLQSLNGAAFDRMYLTGAVDVHERLRRVQDSYLSEGRNMHNRHIATLARGRILEHITEATNLQRMA